MTLSNRPANFGWTFSPRISRVGHIDLRDFRCADRNVEALIDFVAPACPTGASYQSVGNFFRLIKIPQDGSSSGLKSIISTSRCVVDVSHLRDFGNIGDHLRLGCGEKPSIDFSKGKPCMPEHACSIKGSIFALVQIA